MTPNILKKISINQLKPGMFVHKILEQKGQLSVKNQGRVTSDAIVDTLIKRGVVSLVIDTSKAFKVASEQDESEQENKKEADEEGKEVG